MKIKTIVGIALFIAFLLVGNILLLGMVPTEIFIPIYFIFVLVCVLIAFFSVKKSITKKKDIALFMLLGIVLAFSVTFYISEFRTYTDITDSYTLTKDELSKDIELIEEQNKYYSEYTDYQLELANKYDKDTETLLNQFESELQSSSDIKDETIKNLEEALELANQRIDELLKLLEEVENQEPQIVYIEIEKEKYIEETSNNNYYEEEEEDAEEEEEEEEEEEDD